MVDSVILCINQICITCLEPQHIYHKYVCVFFSFTVMYKGIDIFLMSNKVHQNVKYTGFLNI